MQFKAALALFFFLAAAAIVSSADVKRLRQRYSLCSKKNQTVVVGERVSFWAQYKNERVSGCEAPRWVMQTEPYDGIRDFPPTIRKIQNGPTLGDLNSTATDVTAMSVHHDKGHLEYMQEYVIDKAQMNDTGYYTLFLSCPPGNVTFRLTVNIDPNPTTAAAPIRRRIRPTTTDLPEPHEYIMFTITPMAPIYPANDLFLSMENIILVFVICAAIVVFSALYRLCSPSRYQAVAAKQSFFLRLQ